MTKILYFTLKIKGGGREGGTCEVLRPCHPLKIWNVHLFHVSKTFYALDLTMEVDQVRVEDGTFQK